MTRIAAFTLVLAGGLPTIAAEIPITTCGTTVTAGDIGVLQHDLGCPTTSGSVAVSLENGATLDLHGQSITGGDDAVRCLGRRCRVYSSTTTGIMRNHAFGVVGPDGVATRISLGNLEIQNSSVAAAHTDQFTSGRINGKDIMLTNCVQGITANRINLRDFTALGSTIYAVQGVRNARLRDCLITQNPGYGVEAQRLSLRDCTVTDNGTVPLANGIDIRSTHRPRVVGSTCGRSQKLSAPSEDWDVCTGD